MSTCSLLLLSAYTYLRCASLLSTVLYVTDLHLWPFSCLLYFSWLHLAIFLCWQPIWAYCNFTFLPDLGLCLQSFHIPVRESVHVTSCLLIDSRMQLFISHFLYCSYLITPIRRLNRCKNMNLTPIMTDYSPFSVRINLWLINYAHIHCKQRIVS